MNQKPVKTQDVVVLFTKDHLTLREIASRVGMTHTAVWKRLRRAGIESRAGTWVKAECSFCGKPIEKRRAYFKKHDRHFCNSECYYAFRENPKYRPWRQGQRLARALVTQYFAIPDGAIVHHKDGDNRNNDLSNLAVIANNSDHLKLHHGKRIDFLWEGNRTV